MEREYSTILPIVTIVGKIKIDVLNCVPDLITVTAKNAEEAMGKTKEKLEKMIYVITKQIITDHLTIPQETKNNVSAKAGGGKLP